MAKSKEFIVERLYGDCYIEIKYLNGRSTMFMDYNVLVRNFGIKLAVGQKKRIKITIKEVK